MSKAITVSDETYELLSKTSLIETDGNEVQVNRPYHNGWGFFFGLIAGFYGAVAFIAFFGRFYKIFV